MRRNEDRFPSDFMFRLTAEEYADLKSQSGTSSDGHGGRRYSPYVFTEQGVAMLSSVLRSKQAAVVNIEFGEHEKHLAALFKALKQLASPPPPKPRHPIGFSPPETKKK